MEKRRKTRKSSKKEDFSFKNEYKKSWGYLKESRDFVYIAILLFFIFAIIGFFFQDLVNLFVNWFLGIDLNVQILEFIEQMLAQTEGMSQKELIGFIFFNNLQSSFFSMIFGILFAILPIVALVSNGYLLGVVAWITVQIEGPLVLWKLFPHGLFELPAIFLSLGLGLKLGTLLFRKKHATSFKDYIINSLRVFLLIILPLLIIAALIEGSLIFLSE